MRKTFFYIGCLLVVTNFSSCSSFRENWDKLDEAWERVLWFIADVRGKVYDVQDLQEEANKFNGKEGDGSNKSNNTRTTSSGDDNWFERLIFREQKVRIDSIQYKFQLQEGNYGTLMDYQDHDPPVLLLENAPDSLKGLKKGAEVFGWHPHWVEKDYYKRYPYSLLSQISFFSYDINPNNGNPKDSSAIAKWQDFVRWTKGDTVRAQNPSLDVLLTVSCFGRKNIDEFLKAENQTQWDTLFKNLQRLLVVDSVFRADGICLNFEDVPSGNASQFHEFSRQLYKKLNTSIYNGKGFNMSLTLPAKSSQAVYSYDFLRDTTTVKNTYIFENGHFILMGYDFHISSKAVPRPVSPIRELQHSVNTYKARVGKPEKIILAIPYYGAKWTRLADSLVIKPNKADPSKNDITHIPRYDSPTPWAYDKIQKLISNHPPIYQRRTIDAVEAIYLNDQNQREYLRYDDSVTLGQKYKLILSEELGGVGLWALGYAEDTPIMWDLLYKKLGQSRDPVERRPYFFAEALTTHQVALLAVGIFILLGLLSGFVMSLFHWKVREALFLEKRLILTYFIAFLVVAAMITTLQPVEWLTPTASMLLGLLLGIAATYSINYMINRRRNNVET